MSIKSTITCTRKQAFERLAEAYCPINELRRRRDEKVALQFAHLSNAALGNMLDEYDQSGVVGEIHFNNFLVSDDQEETNNG
jgi:hypothetical protein